MKMRQQRAGLFNGNRLILLLDVHVEGVEVQFHCLGTDGLDEFESLITGVQKIGFEPVQGLNAEGHSLGFRILGQGLEILDHQGEVLLLFGVGMGADTTHHRVNGPNDRRATQDHRLIDEGLHVGRGRGLFFGSAPEIPTRPHARANAANNQTMLVGRSLDLDGIDMLRGLNREFQRVETPLLELGEQLH